MDPSSIPDLAGLPPKLQLHLLTLYIILKGAGAAYSSIRSGGGLKRILTAFWLGENLPKVVAQDYKTELSNPPFPPKDSPPL